MLLCFLFFVFFSQFSGRVDIYSHNYGCADSYSAWRDTC